MDGSGNQTLSLVDIDELLQQAKTRNCEVLGQEETQEIESKVIGQKEIPKIIDDLINFFDLSRMNLCGTNLQEARLKGANLQGAIIDEFGVKVMEDRFPE